MIMCGKGWITFEMGCAMVLGSNIGTTIPGALLGGNSAAEPPSGICSTASAPWNTFKSTH